MFTETTEKRKEKFIEALRVYGVVTTAARAASINRSTARQWRLKDPEFAAAWADALEDAVDELEKEAHRRAVQGVEEPVFYQGQQVSVIRRYSDALLITLLKANRPEKYRERVEHSGSVDLNIADRLAQGRQRAGSSGGFGGDKN